MTSGQSLPTPDGSGEETTVGMVFVRYLLQRRAKIAHQAAADAAGVHLPLLSIPASFLKAAVDYNLTEFISMSTSFSPL